MPDLFDYTLRILPGLLLLAGAYLLVRRVVDPLLRIVVLLLGFILIRDALTPVGFWRFGTTDGGVIWLRFTEDSRALVLFATVALVVTVAVLYRSPDLRALVTWGRVRPSTIALGIVGGVLAAAPALLLYTLWPVDDRGGAVAASVMPALLWFALAGNLAEEVLFRGFLQGYLERFVSVVRAALISAVMFAACHIFLATTVTNLGWSLLLFTLYEGLICAFLRARYGLIPAAIAHGLAIFLLASGLP